MFQIVLDGIARILCMCQARHNLSERTQLTRKNSRMHRLIANATMCNGNSDQTVYHTSQPVPEAYPGANKRLHTSSSDAQLDSVQIQQTGNVASRNNQQTRGTDSGHKQLTGSLETGRRLAQGVNCMIGIKNVSNTDSNDNEPCLKIHTVEKKYQDLESQLRTVKEALISMVEASNVKENAATELKVLRNEWKEIATILDRFFFLLYVVIIVISLVSLFPRPLHWGVWGML